MLKSIGIIGGAGPMAGVLLHHKIVHIAQKRYGCREDSHFPRILHVSYPFSDMLSIEAKDNREKIQQELSGCFSLLKGAQTEIIAIACNTLHIFLTEEMTKGVTFIDIVNVTKEALKRSKEILVLCSSTSRTHRLHGSLGKVVYPDKADQKKIDMIINRIVGGDTFQTDADHILSYIEKNEKIDAILLGCTELSELHDKHPILSSLAIPVIDPMTFLADKVCDTSFSSLRLKQ